jgi:hypothetical protein
MLALGEALSGFLEPSQYQELESLAGYTLGAVRRKWQQAGRPLPVFALEAWYALRRVQSEPVEAPLVVRTWTELRPTASMLTRAITGRDLQALDEWLALAQVLARYDEPALQALGFYEQEQRLLGHAAVEVAEIEDAELRPLAESVLARIRDLSPRYGRAALLRFQRTPHEERWWVPEDISAPPTTEPVSHAKSGFTRADVDRVLSDL